MACERVEKILIQQSSSLVFFVNGVKIVDEKIDPEWTLLYYLRNKLKLCGTKLGCAEGGCGACTVMVSRIDRAKNKVVHLAVNACLTPICSVHGASVTTVEGIGSTKTKLHPVQERIAKAHGSQCGFCTPGIVMSMYALLRTLPKPTMADLEIAFQGNLCRCTGYRPIIEGFRGFTEKWEEVRVQNGHANGTTNGCSLGEQCCKKMKKEREMKREQVLFDRSKFTPYDPSQEPIFPPELKLSSQLDEQYLVVKGERATWYRPRTLNELLTLKSNFPNAKIINGNTEVGVEVKFKNFVYPVLIQPILVKELTTIEILERGAMVGAAVTLMDMEAALKAEIKNKPNYQTRIFQAIVDMLNWFAGKQIRNVAAVGGNIMTGSPISDLNPILMAANVELHVKGLNSSRVVIMDHKFFTGYRTNVIQQNEILTAIVIPYTKKNQFFNAYKQAKRRDDDIAIVNCAANLTLDLQSLKVENLIIAYGGVAPITKIATEAGESMIGRTWTEENLERMYDVLVKELPLSPGAPGGMIQYRRTLTLSLMFKFYLYVIETLSKSSLVKPLSEKLRSAPKGFHSAELKSSQYFQMVPKNQSNIDPVGRPVVHVSALKQATGEAIYCDDMPLYEKELYLTLVTSTRAHAKIINIDASKALAVPGVHGFFCHKDIDPERNELGAVVHDEEIFASEKVYCQGQIIGAIVAEDQITSQRAAKLVKIEYEDLLPVIITIEDAIKHNSYIPTHSKSIVKGNPDEEFAKADNIISGSCHMGGQEHFYLETHCTVAVPKIEDNEMEIYSSTQHAAETQKFVALALGIPLNRITVRVKRMGGGFGGKESRANALAVPCALAAHKLGRPVRCMLDRDEDMLISGGRHPFMGQYKVAFRADGVITALEMTLYNNAGYSADLSAAVMDRAMFHFMNSYNIPNSKIIGFVCKTNLPTNTAFRGFGGPQGMFFMENVIDHMADYLEKPAEEIRAKNLFQEGHVTHYNQTLTYCTLQRCWDECLINSDFYLKQKEIKEFNTNNRYKKRGIAILPTMFGIAFTELFMNQTGALVHVYLDGSVLLTHGGTEMGQGLHTKMIQVASRALGIPTSYIYITEMSTDKVPNTSPTAASSGSDLNGMAVLNACETIANRLKPFKEADPKGRWEDWVKAAYFNRVSLSSTGFFKTPDIGYNRAENTGKAFNYFTFGVASTIVEIDCLTGDHQVLRTDIVMDLGESLNPAIDIGQIEGAFLQGYGLFTLEELMYSPTGALLTRGPGMYKIPGFADIPGEFNVSLLRGAPNPQAVFSSKAVGEPPLFLACSAFFAIKEAIKAARQEVGLKGHFQMNSPATAARIRTNCQDKFTKKFPEPDPTSFNPWNVVP